MLNVNLTFSDLENKSLDIVENTSYSINFDEDGLLFFNFKDVSEIKFNVSVAKNVRARIIYWSENDTNVEIEELYEILNDSYLNVIYGELSDGELKRHATANLHKGSEILVEGASVTSSKKHQTFIANHTDKYTTSNLNNYGIVAEGGDFFLDVVGRIMIDAVGAKAHQDSKILTLSENQKTQVVPQLLIYENDVEASHAATVGQIDEMQLYYLQSRGLSEMESMALLMSGYLMPIANAIEDKELSDHVKELIASKVDEICSTERK